MARRKTAAARDSRPVITVLPPKLIHDSFNRWRICSECRRELHPARWPMCPSCASAAGVLVDRALCASGAARLGTI